MHGAEPSNRAVVVGARAAPDDLTEEPLAAEERVEDQPQLVARCRIAVQVKAARGLEDTMELKQASSHHGRIR
jgi:hypothetical protein